MPLPQTSQSIICLVVLLPILSSSIFLPLSLTASAETSEDTRKGFIETDRQSYSQTDNVVMIKGNVGQVRGDHPAAIINVTGPDGEVYRLDRVSVDNEGWYIYELPISNKAGIIGGTYTITVIYDNESNAKTTFLLYKNDLDGYNVFDMKINDDNNNNKTYPVKYRIAGGRVLDMIWNANEPSITIAISATSNGTLALKMPRFILDYNNQLLPYIQKPSVFIDEASSEVRADTLLCDAEYTMQFAKGSEKIVLAGTPVLGGGTSRDSYYHSANYLQSGAKHMMAAGYPLTIPITSAEGKNFTLSAITSADTCDFSFMQKEKRFHADIAGPENNNGEGKKGYFEVTLPHDFLGGKYTVFVNDEPATNFNATYSKGESGAPDSTTISLGYDGRTTKSIDIIGTAAAPEFGSSTAPIVMAITTAATIILAALRRRKIGL